MPKKARRPWVGRFNGVNPLELLSDAAQAIVKNGRCRVYYTDVAMIYEMPKSVLVALSQRIERNTGDTMRTCIEDAKPTVPTKTDAKKFKESQQKAKESAISISSALSFDMESHLQTFAVAHGWINSSELQEVCDCWREMLAAWNGFKRTCEEVTDV